MKILSKLVTSADVSAALDRISAVADPEDVNCVRSELARMRLVLDSGDDEDLPYMAPLSVTHYTMRRDYDTGGTPPCMD